MHNWQTAVGSGMERESKGVYGFRGLHDRSFAEATPSASVRRSRKRRGDLVHSRSFSAEEISTSWQMSCEGGDAAIGDQACHQKACRQALAKNGHLGVTIAKLSPHIPNIPETSCSVAIETAFRKVTNAVTPPSNPLVQQQRLQSFYMTSCAAPSFRLR
jgi:hypothetical protein